MTDRRRSLLAAIHTGRRRLGLDEDVWRALLRRVTGCGSLREVDEDGLRLVLEELRARGFAGFRRLDEPHQRKIMALWRAMWRRGLVRERDPDGFVRRMAGVDRLEWLRADDALPIIEALKEWSEREPAGHSAGDRRGSG